MEFRGKWGDHMEIINLHSGLFKMPVMRKFNGCSSESKSRKIAVNFTCGYHFCSYLRCPFLLSQTCIPRFCFFGRLVWFVFSNLFH